MELLKCSGVKNRLHRCSGLFGKKGFCLLWSYLVRVDQEDRLAGIADVAFFINYIFIGDPAPNPLALGDPTGDCLTNAADVVYLINYLFTAGPDPEWGCQ